jgi:branched-subunit amino acid transport protein
MEAPMSDKTVFAIPGKKMQVPRVFKRTLQVAFAVGLTAAVALGLMMGSGLLQAKGSSVQVWNVWLAFINRPDIQATMVLTAIVTVLFVYWQRDQERR